MFGKRGATEEIARPRIERAGGAPPAAAEKPPAASPVSPRPVAVPQAAPQPKPQPSATAPSPSAASAPAAPPRSTAAPSGAPTLATDNRSDHYYQVKTMIFSALIDTIDLAQLAQLDVDSAREEIRDIVNEIITIKSVVMSIAEQEQLLTDICNDVLGYGPLEPLLARDDIADIMVNGASRVFIEVAGKVQLTNVRFRDNAQLMNICQRIVSQVGRRVDGRSRCNTIISGGTGSGKTTLLNCLTAYIDADERIVTCEDAAELQLQQPHVVRLETRPPNLEGQGQITMRDLVRNCLRMRPERIIVGEVRGPEAFDLLQAMNAGHDGSMGTVHANSPREALSRLESLITMGGYNLPSKTIREMIVGSIDVIVQAERLRDGSRRITNVTEVIGTEGEVIITQDILTYNIEGEDESGRIRGKHAGTGIARPAFWDRARYFGLEHELSEALDAAQP